MTRASCGGGGGVQDGEVGVRFNLTADAYKSTDSRILAMGYE